MTVLRDIELIAFIPDELLILLEVVELAFEFSQLAVDQVLH